MGRGPHAADEAREASPMPPAPAKTNGVLFPEDDFATRPADAKIVHPSPTVDADYARVTANCMTRFFECSPAQGANVAFFIQICLLMSAVCLQRNDSRDGMSVGSLTGS
jgi:hypothetical protein